MNKDELELRIAVLNEETDATYINILDKAVEKREEWEIYSFKRIKKIFHLDDEDAKMLLSSRLFKIYHAGNDFRIKKVSVEHNKKIIHSIVNYRDNKTMSVQDLGHILGLGKTSTYGLLNKMCFKSYVIFGKIRIDVDSFEKWYASQFHYKKVNGERPGAKYRNTLPVLAYAEVLGCPKSSINRLINSKRLPCILVEGKRRIDKEAFEKWYQSQNYFKKVKEVEEVECYYD